MERSQLAELDRSSLIELIVVLQAQLVEQGKQIQKLSDQVAKTSQNNSKPPGSDGLKKPNPQSLGAKGEKPYGGQPGHKGDTLQMVVEPDVIIEHAVTRCPHCQADLCQVEAVGYDKRQVFAIPLVQFEVTEHRVAIKACPGCGGKVQEDFPDAVSQPTQYGPRMKAQASYLNTYHCLPLARAPQNC